MKKLIYIMMIFALIFALFSVSVFAESESAVTEGNEETEEFEETVFTRLWEYFNDNFDMIMTFLADSVLLVVAFFVTKGGKGLATRMISTMAKGASEETQDKLVNGFNAMIEENAELKGKVEQLESLLSKVNDELVNVHKESKAVLESMFTVWTQSSNLPKCIKEIVASNYANCIKAEGENDEGQNP